MSDVKFPPMPARLTPEAITRMTRLAPRSSEAPKFPCACGKMWLSADPPGEWGRRIEDGDRYHSLPTCGPRSDNVALCAAPAPLPSTKPCQRPKGHDGDHQSSEAEVLSSWPQPRSAEPEQRAAPLDVSVLASAEPRPAEATRATPDFARARIALRRAFDAATREDMLREIDVATVRLGRESPRVEWWVVLWDPPINKLRVAQLFTSEEGARAFAASQVASGWRMNVEVIRALAPESERATPEGKVLVDQKDYRDLCWNLDGVSGALIDAATVTVHDADYGKSIRELTAQRDALGKLNTELNDSCVRYEKELSALRKVAEAARAVVENASAVCGIDDLVRHGLVRELREALHALESESDDTT